MQDKKNLQILSSSVMVFIICFICLILLNQSNSSTSIEDSQLLPLVLNTTEPFLITGNIDRLQPELEQLIAGSTIERIDVHGADSSLLASVRNIGIASSSLESAHEFSSSIVIDDALAANLLVREYRQAPASTIWPHLLISFACALATAIVSLMLNRLLPTSLELPVLDISSANRPEEAQEFEPKNSNLIDESISSIPLPIDTNPKGYQRMVLMIRIADVKDQLIRNDAIDNYMDRIWKITDRMAATYGISCIGVQAGVLVFSASASNNAVALRHCIMFGWNLSKDEQIKASGPASLIAPIDFMGENPSHALALSMNDELIHLEQRLLALNEGEFCVCKSIQENLPKSVDAIDIENNNLKVLSIETRMLDLWKKQTQLQS